MHLRVKYVITLYCLLMCALNAIRSGYRVRSVMHISYVAPLGLLQRLGLIFIQFLKANLRLGLESIIGSAFRLRHEEDVVRTIIYIISLLG